MTPQDAVCLAEKYTGTSPRGVSCQFIPLDENWGLKTYLDEKKRDEAHDTQYDVWVSGCGPEVGNKVNMGGKYCYITQRVKPLIDQDANFMDEIMKAGKVFPDRAMRARIDFIKEVSGWEMFDCHYGNWGVLEGEFVPLDFGND